VAEFLNVNEVSLELQNVFLFDFELLDGVELSVGFVLALINASVSSFSQFFQELVFFQERVIS